jgi:hypothetical protein
MTAKMAAEDKLMRFELAAAAVALVLLFALIPHAITGDGLVRYDSLNTLLTKGEVAEQRYSYVGPLAAAPIWIQNARTRRMWWAERFNVILLAAGAAAAWRLLRGSASPAVRASFVLILVAAGMMPNHVRNFYGEVFTAVTVATGLLVVLVANHRAGWVLVALGVANTPASLGGLAAVAAWRWWRARKYDGAVAVVAAAAIVLLENYFVRGGFLESSYSGDQGFRTVMPFSGRSGFSYPLLPGVLSLLFSFGKGLLFFAPGLLFVAQARRAADRKVADLLDAWLRFLLIAVYPSALALAIVLSAAPSWRRRLVVAAALLWTFWVGVSGAVFGTDGLGLCMDNSYALEHLCWYVPEFSPLFRHLVIRPPGLEGWQIAWMVFAIAPAAVLAARALRLDD